MCGATIIASNLPHPSHLAAPPPPKGPPLTPIIGINLLDQHGYPVRNDNRTNFAYVGPNDGKQQPPEIYYAYRPANPKDPTPIPPGGTAQLKNVSCLPAMLAVGCGVVAGSLAACQLALGPSGSCCCPPASTALNLESTAVGLGTCWALTMPNGWLAGVQCYSGGCCSGCAALLGYNMAGRQLDSTKEKDGGGLCLACVLRAGGT